MSNDQKKVFIVTPIGGNSTETRRSAEGVIDAVIIPVLIDLGFDVENINVAHRINTAGSINKQLITRIIEDDLVIANLTKLNPNVMYELAIRHAIRKPVIQICEEGTVLPFDIIDERTIFYKNDMFGVTELKKGLENYVEEALSDECPDNPIYRAIESQMILQSSSSQDVDMNKYLIERLDSIEKTLSRDANSHSVPKDLKVLTNTIQLTVESNIKLSEIAGEIKAITGRYGFENIRLSMGINREINKKRLKIIFKEDNAPNLKQKKIIVNDIQLLLDKKTILM
ncbi:hypothetical protein ACQKMD_11135 [Viridibacillus sp. NPDC096237]|uniref:hypothetical protein n=1 Tax=Viridibacillus sp. NPDC096237 TaxID=3390721 RepID=UPI003D02F3A1